MVQVFVYNKIWYLDYQEVNDEIELTGVYLYADKNYTSNLIDFMTDDVLSKLLDELKIQLIWN